MGDILSETAHEESWRRIQEIEAPKEKTPGNSSHFRKKAWKCVSIMVLP